MRSVHHIDGQPFEYIACLPVCIMRKEELNDKPSVASLGDKRIQNSMLAAMSLNHVSKLLLPFTPHTSGKIAYA